MMLTLQSARHRYIIRFTPIDNQGGQVEPGRPFKVYSAMLMCVFLFQVPLLLSFMGGSFSPAYALDDRKALTQRITGFSGEEAHEIQSALDNLEQKKNVRFWIYRSNIPYETHYTGSSEAHTHISDAAHTLTTKFTNQDSLLLLSTYGLKTNGKCDEDTCPITIVGDWVTKNVSYHLIFLSENNLRYLAGSGKPKLAVVRFLNDLANSSTKPYGTATAEDRTPTLLAFLCLGLVFITIYVIYTLYDRGVKKKQGRLLAWEQLNDPKKLAQVPTLALETYSKKLLNSVTKRIDMYGLAIRKADDELGEANIPEFHQAYDQAKEALQKAHHIHQLLDDDVKDTKPQKRSMLIELITTLQTANNNLAKTAYFINEKREEFFKAPDLMKKLVQKSIDLEGRIPSSTTTLDALKKSYSNEILSPVLNNIHDAHDELDNAKQALDLGQNYLEKGNPKALDYIHTADTALQKMTKLLDDLDLFEANAHATINQ